MLLAGDGPERHGPSGWKQQKSGEETSRAHICTTKPPYRSSVSCHKIVPFSALRKFMELLASRAESVSSEAAQGMQRCRHGRCAQAEALPHALNPRGLCFGHDGRFVLW
jgi:hypothetical protein